MSVLNFFPSVSKEKHADLRRHWVINKEFDQDSSLTLLFIPTLYVRCASHQSINTSRHHNPIPCLKEKKILVSVLDFGPILIRQDQANLIPPKSNWILSELIKYANEMIKGEVWPQYGVNAGCYGHWCASSHSRWGLNLPRLVTWLRGYHCIHQQECASGYSNSISH